MTTRDTPIEARETLPPNQYIYGWVTKMKFNGNFIHGYVWCDEQLSWVKIFDSTTISDEPFLCAFEVGTPAPVTALATDCTPLANEVKDKMVHHPKHYNDHPSGVECIEIVRHMSFNIGNVIKYLWRAGLKQSVGVDLDKKRLQDLEKAKFYLEDEIEYTKNNIDKKNQSG